MAGGVLKARNATPHGHKGRTDLHPREDVVISLALIPVPANPVRPLLAVKVDPALLRAAWDEISPEMRVGRALLLARLGDLGWLCFFLRCVVAVVECHSVGLVLGRLHLEGGGREQSVEGGWPEGVVVGGQNGERTRFG